MIAVGGFLKHPAQIVVVGFVGAVAAGSVLLLLPISSNEAGGTGIVDAVFTATSAVSVTGLLVVETSAHWTVFGQLVILGLIQVGGLGIMTLATVFALVFFRRAGLRTQRAVAVETKTLSVGDLKGIVIRIAIFAAVAELIAMAFLSWRLIDHHAESVGSGLYNGFFLAVSSFNNAGFSPYTPSVERFVADPWILGVLSVAVIVGGLGFPVVLELLRRWRHPRTWSILTKVTLVVSGLLLLVGTLAFWIAEHDHVGTLARLDRPHQFTVAFFTSAMTRTAGFNAIPESELQPESVLLTNIFMFIGGGSAGTAGGIKVTTVGLLLFVVWAEMRGRSEATIGRRRIGMDGQRQALSIVTLSLGLVSAATFAIMALTPFSFEAVLFEVISAFGTVGLSLGITPELSAPAKLLLAFVMFIGRIGPLTLAVALAARSKASLVRLPEERMIVG